MQDIQVHIWCDQHYSSEQTRVGAHSYVLSLPGTQNAELDLCAECAQEMLQPLAALLATAGRPAQVMSRPSAGKGPGKAAGRGPDRAASGGESGGPSRMGRPRKDDRVRKPGEIGLLSEHEGGFGCMFCDMVSASFGGLKQHLSAKHALTVRMAFGTTCPLCGEEHAMLGGHLTSAHMMPTHIHAFDAARAAGDPHGVVAERESGVTMTRAGRMTVH